MPSDIPSDIFANDFDAIKDRNSVSATLTRWSDGSTASATGILTAVENKQKDVDAGFFPEFDAQFIVGVAELPATRPVVKDKWTIASTVYQIVSFTNEPSDTAVTYFLSSNAN